VIKVSGHFTRKIAGLCNITDQWSTCSAFDALECFFAKSKEIDLTKLSIVVMDGLVCRGQLIQS